MTRYNKNFLNAGKNRGATMVETLFYVFVFAALSLVLIDAMINMTKAFRETTIYTSLMQGGDIMEKISREIKQAESIAIISATSIKVNTTDNTGTEKTVTFSLSGSDVQMYENDVLIGNLNSPTLLVSNLSFDDFTTPAGTAVKFSFTISSVKDVLARTQNFYNTVAMRGSY